MSSLYHSLHIEENSEYKCVDHYTILSDDVEYCGYTLPVFHLSEILVFWALSGLNFHSEEMIEIVVMPFWSDKWHI